MQNDMRDRLVELLSIIPCNAESCSAVCDGRCQEFDDLDRCQIGQLADHLIANGVIVIPCKVGDIVYQTNGVRIYELEIFDVSLYRNMPHFETENVDFDIRAIGTSIFLTKDQAEQKLKEMRGENG